MGNILAINDLSTIIYHLSNNYYCALVSKSWYKTILRNADVCEKCNKIVKIYGIHQWITDESDNSCHGYYCDKNPTEQLKYYQRIKSILYNNPTFIKAIRQCHVLNYRAVSRDPSTIQYIHNPSKEMILYALEKNAKYIKYIHNPSEEMILYALEKNGMVLKYIIQNEFNCLKAIESNPLAIQYVKNKTNQLSLQSVNMNGLCLEFIPETLQTQEICDNAVNNNMNAFKHVIEKYQTHHMCLKALNYDFKFIEYIKNPIEEYYIKILELSPQFFNKIFYSHGITHTYYNFYGEKNISMGQGSLNNNVYGSNNIVFGINTGINIMNTDNNILIDNHGKKNDNNVIRIGTNQLKNYQAGIYGTEIKDCVPVYITSSGQLGIKK